MRSRTELIFRRAAVSAFITSTLGTRTICVMGVKSFTASYGIFEKSHGLIACVATAEMPIVSPSGGALATMSAPMLPPPPGLLSMITGPSESFTRSARSRAVASMGPPAAYGTTRRIGRCCANAGSAIAPAAARRKGLLCIMCRLRGGPMFFRLTGEGVGEELVGRQLALRAVLLARGVHHDGRTAR